MPFQPNQWTINKGEDAQIAVHLLDDQGNPMSGAGATAISLKLKNQDGSVLSVPAYTGMAIGLFCPIFIYGFNLTGAQTALLPIGPMQTVELEIDFGTAKKFQAIRQALTVTQPVI